MKEIVITKGVWAGVKGNVVEVGAMYLIMDRDGCLRQVAANAISYI